MEIIIATHIFFQFHISPCNCVWEDFLFVQFQYLSYDEIIFSQT